MIRLFTIYFMCALLFTLLAQERTVMTREEAAIYALRLASALNIPIRWLNTSNLPTGEEVADVEYDKIDFYALQGLNYDNIISINSTKKMYFHGWLNDVNYIFPSDDGDILVNAFSGEVLAIGKFLVNITETLNEEQALNIALSIIRSFYKDINYQYKLNIMTENDGDIVIYFRSFNPDLKHGCHRGFIGFSSEGFIYTAKFYPPLIDDPIINITEEQAKQIIINAINEVSSGKRKFYFISGAAKIKLPKIYFVCFGKHPDVIIPPKDYESLLELWNFEDGDGIYFIEEDDFLQKRYAYVISTTIEIENIGKVFTYYLVDTDTGEVEGFGLTNIYFQLLGFSGKDIIKGKIRNIYQETKITHFVLNNQLIRLKDIIFKGNCVYVPQNCLFVFKVQLQNNRLLGRNGEIRLAKDELRRFKGKTYVPLRRVCEVSGIRLWWDNERKVPILRAEWLEPKKLLAQKR